MKFYVSVLCPTRNKGCHSRLCGFFCIKWKSIQSYHYSCIEESSLFSKNWWCDKYLWIGLFHLIFWCKLLLLSKATFSFNLGKKTVPKYEGGHYFVSLGKRGAGKASSAQGHWMRAELAGVGAEVLYFFQSDLNICVCYLQPSLQPPGQSVLPDFFFFFYFFWRKNQSWIWQAEKPNYAPWPPKQSCGVQNPVVQLQIPVFSHLALWVGFVFCFLSICCS